MAKLYAELSSDKAGRTVSKGGNEFISCDISDGNTKILRVEYNRENNELYVQNETENMLITLNGEDITS